MKMPIQEEQSPTPSQRPSFLTTARLVQHAVVALWWTLHAWSAAAFLCLTLGNFEEGRFEVGAFQAAEMADVLQFLGVPLNPWLALGLVFLTFFAIARVAGSVWHGMLRTLRVTDLNSVAQETLRWAARRQLRVGWLALTLACNGAMVIALRPSQGGGLAWAAAVFLLIVYAVPILVLRPRWFGMPCDDLSRLPAMAALGTLVLLSMLDWMLVAGLDALMGKLGGLLSLVPTLFLIWLTASALLFVRSASDIRSHLATRMNRRFLALALLGTAQPVIFFVVWLMPVLLLTVHYAIFIGPSVSQLAPFLPDAFTVTHRLFSSFAGLMTNYWWIMSIPLVTVVWNLYVGRCLTVFECSDRQSSALSTDRNTFP